MNLSMPRLPRTRRLLVGALAGTLALGVLGNRFRPVEPTARAEKVVMQSKTEDIKPPSWGGMTARSRDVALRPKYLPQLRSAYRLTPSEARALEAHADQAGLPLVTVFESIHGSSLLVRSNTAMTRLAEARKYEQPSEVMDLARSVHVAASAAASAQSNPALRSAIQKIAAVSSNPTASRPAVRTFAHFRIGILPDGTQNLLVKSVYDSGNNAAQEQARQNPKLAAYLEWARSRSGR